MRTLRMALMLLPAALACSDGGTSPTEAQPDFATACSPAKPKIVADPTAVTRLPGATGTTKFTVRNNCGTTLTGWSLKSSRSGVVTSVGAPSRATLPSLSPNQSVNVYVSYRLGSSGTGSVVLLARSASGLNSFGYQGVTVGTSAGF